MPILKDSNMVPRHLQSGYIEATVRWLTRVGGRCCGVGAGAVTREAVLYYMYVYVEIPSKDHR